VARPTGCQDFQPLALFEQLDGQLGDGINDMLACVQDQERATFSQVVGQSFCQPPAGLLLQV